MQRKRKSRSLIELGFFPKSNVLQEFQEVADFVYFSLVVKNNELKNFHKTASDPERKRLTKYENVRLLQVLVFLTFLYGGTTKAKDYKKINAFKMWAYEKMLCIV